LRCAETIYPRFERTDPRRLRIKKNCFEQFVTTQDSDDNWRQVGWHRSRSDR
jgi:hypothetical protein